MPTCPPSRQHYTSHPNRFHIPQQDWDTLQGNRFPSCSHLHLMLWLHIYSNHQEADPQRYFQIHTLRGKIPGSFINMVKRKYQNQHKIDLLKPMEIYLPCFYRFLKHASFSRHLSDHSHKCKDQQASLRT